MTNQQLESPASLPAARRQAPCLRGHWLLGCGAEMQKDPLDFYLRAWQKCGDIARLRLFPGVHCYLVSHPDAVEQVLQKHHKNYRKPDLFNRSIRPMVGEGLIVSEGPFWLQQRRLMQPAFHRQHLVALAPKMTAAAEACLADWDRLPAGQPRDILDDMMRLSVRIAGMTLFSTDISADADAIGRAFRVSFTHVSKRMNSLPIIPDWLPTASNRQFAAAKQLLDRVVLELITARRQDPNPPRDFLSLLLAAQDEETGVGMSDEQVKNEALTLLTAGHDTVGASLAWAWYLLGQNPALQEEVHDEVRGVLQGRTPTPDDLPRLPLTRAVFDETLRLYPPAWGMPREAIAADEIMGFAIPRKSVLILGTWVTHRRPDLWPEPEQFRPERFLDSAPPRPRFAYYPFGGGPRICIGQTFALLEGPLVLATLIQRYRIALVSDDQVVPDPTFTLRPRDGVRVTLQRRG